MPDFAFLDVTMKRRTIQLSSLDGVLEEAQRLLRGGYDRAGNWSLGQACNHLAIGIEMTTQGLVARIPNLVQRLIVATYFRLFFLGKIGNRFGWRMPTNAPQKEPVADEIGVQRLSTAIGQLQKTNAAHWNRMHIWHCQHHFSYLIPTGDASTSTAPTASP